MVIMDDTFTLKGKPSSSNLGPSAFLSFILEPLTIVYRLKTGTLRVRIPSPPLWGRGGMVYAPVNQNDSRQFALFH